jgi:hypothetical protein
MFRKYILGCLYNLLPLAAFSQSIIRENVSSYAIANVNLAWQSMGRPANGGPVCFVPLANGNFFYAGYSAGATSSSDVHIQQLNSQRALFGATARRGNGHLQLYSVTGSKVLEQAVTGTKTFVWLRDLPQGSYLYTW